MKSYIILIEVTGITKVGKIKSPGQLKSHYSPGIPVKINSKIFGKNDAVIGFGKKFSTKKKLIFCDLKISKNFSEEYKRLLFRHVF